jgi:hypothetical protein
MLEQGSRVVTLATMYAQAALEGVSLRAYLDHRQQEAARAKRVAAEETAVRLQLACHAQCCNTPA